MLFSVMFVFLTLWFQADDQLIQVRKDFQEIRGEDELETLINLNVVQGLPDSKTVEAYKAAGTCMMAEYVFSPIKKLKYFNEGKADLEEIIEEEKTVEKVYLRLLIQLNVPRMLGYYKEIEGDIQFLKQGLPEADIDSTYKKTMIDNLVALADKDELKQSLLDIDLSE